MVAKYSMIGLFKCLKNELRCSEGLLDTVRIYANVNDLDESTIRGRNMKI